MTRRIVWALVVSSGAALYVGCSPCASSGKPANDVPAGITLADGGIGDPCDTTTQCSAGLDCRDTFPVTDTYVETATFRSCTLDCTSTACPSGSVCLDAPSGVAADGGALRFCVPGCTTESNCQTGHRAGLCALADAGVAADGGTAADAGSASGTCQPIVCGGVSSTATCPSSYLCQETYYGGRNNGCYASGAAMAAPRAAWCGKQ